MSLSKNPKLLEVAKMLCRELRKNSTPSERKFWEMVRNNQISNNKFYRQYALYFDYYGKETFYIADFYCHRKKLVVEIDGKIHDYQKKRDDLRTHIINSLGIQVIRFTNVEIDENIYLVKQRLAAILST